MAIYENKTDIPRGSRGYKSVIQISKLTGFWQLMIVKKNCCLVKDIKTLCHNSLRIKEMSDIIILIESLNI